MAGVLRGLAAIDPFVTVGVVTAYSADGRTPLAIARGTVFYASNDNDDNQSNVYALTLP